MINTLLKLTTTPFLVSMTVSALVTPLVIFIYRQLRLVEDPKKHKTFKTTHTTPVPRGGGIPIFLGILIASILFLPADKHLLGILAGALIITITGVFDDKKDLSPYLRLGLGFLAAGAVVASGIGIGFITNPFNGTIALDSLSVNFELFGKPRSILVLADTFALFWIVGLSNITNWAKGFDGQLPGIVVIASITICLLSLKFSADITQWPVVILAAIVSGAYLGFLPFNFFPQKIMPGYGGGALAGFMLAVLTILSTTKVGTGIVVLGVPIIDAAYSIIRRVLSGRSPVWGDRGHLHHGLLDKLGWGKRRTAIFYWGITAILGFLALSLNSQQKFYTIAMLAIVIGGILLWLNFLSTFSSQSGQNNRSKT